MSGPSDESLAAEEKSLRAAIESEIPPGHQTSWDIPIKEGAMPAPVIARPDAGNNAKGRKWPRLLSAVFTAVVGGGFLVLMLVTDMDTLSGILAGGATNAQSDILAPAARYDVLKFKLDEAVRAKNHKQTIAIIARLRATGSALGGEIPFYEGRAHIALKNRTGAYHSLATYLNSVGRKGKNYKKAIALFVKSERAMKMERPLETDS